MVPFDLIRVYSFHRFCSVHSRWTLSLISLEYILSTDFALSIPTELESALRMKTMRFLVTQRPWLGSVFNPNFSHEISDLLQFFFFKDSLSCLGSVFQIFMELMWDLLHHLGVRAANLLLIMHSSIVLFLMNCYMRYCIFCSEKLFDFIILMV